MKLYLAKFMKFQFLIIILFFLSNFIAYAQNSNSSLNFIVEGNQRIETDTILSYINLTPDSKATNSEINSSLKSLYATGLFSDVTIKKNNNTIVISVIENAIINRIYIEGNKRLKTEDLLNEIQLRPRLTYSRSKIQSDSQRILDLYRLSGRFDASVDPKIINLPKNRVDLVFEINEGTVTKINKIEFIGNKVFSDRRLKERYQVKLSHFFVLLLYLIDLMQIECF